ncbi:PsaB RNA binding protein [Coccomyxa subellipsoidea C-169]|uniref:PsaB RNA binding protein n=1 Tax=Coccomyxa subellipsoidea (strain C-169) TaxID=574566 RepID=I0YV71_COCSC|nr:PsaB RNA binding protein [Coccomyxa subellipsoidea C-169]EIE22290.1 PsaB RNA binding protein [Coccomyxa subellipsoidea C-169]|eukprot:XP_005646834.1 PsaB RNA binding protein [Coccomyxa subellipsoidea C-169]
MRLLPEEEEAPSTSVPTFSTWELDFSSRPILDARGKKRWELLICSPDRSWVYSKWFPNNRINSTQLKAALQEIIEAEGAVKPQTVRFFRGQMQTIISRALADLDIKPVPSRRCFSLIGLLEERLETVYKRAAGYSDKATSLFTLDLGPPQDLPDALRGESWLFVQLPLGLLREELRAVDTRQTFGANFALASAGLADLPDDTPIPGVAVYSRRAVPLAAWTSGLEVANVAADADRACLVLETGVNQRWRYGNYQRTPENTADARAWEAAKIAARGLHFLVVQADEEADTSAGLWLLQARELPKI